MDRINCVSPLTPTDWPKLSDILKKKGTERLFIGLDENSPDTVQRLCELCPGRVYVRLSERGGWCKMLTFSPPNLNMWTLHLIPGLVPRLHQVLSLSQSWSVEWSLGLRELGPGDWAELCRSVETLGSVREVCMTRCSPPPVSLLERLWTKTEEVWSVDEERYYKTQEEDFTRLMRHFHTVTVPGGSQND